MSTCQNGLGNAHDPPGFVHELKILPKAGVNSVEAWTAHDIPGPKFIANKTAD